MLFILFALFFMFVSAILAHLPILAESGPAVRLFARVVALPWAYLNKFTGIETRLEAWEKKGSRVAALVRKVFRVR